MPSTGYRENESTSFDEGRTRAKTLLGLCEDSFLLVMHIQAGNDPGHPEDLRKSIAYIFETLEQRAKRLGFSEEDIKATRYALCALIDETILNSRWAFIDQWRDQPLQLVYFGEPLAGVRFFDLLGRIRKKGRDKVDLLEVFCMCLVLGFQGKYKGQKQEELAEATRTLIEEANSLRGGPGGLAPHWGLPDEPVEAPPKTIPQWAWITGAASVALVILVYFVFKLWLGSDASAAIRQMIM